MTTSVNNSAVFVLLSMVLTSVFYYDCAYAEGISAGAAEVMPAMPVINDREIKRMADAGLPSIAIIKRAEARGRTVSSVVELVITLGRRPSTVTYHGITEGYDAGEVVYGALSGGAHLREVLKAALYGGADEAEVARSAVDFGFSVGDVSDVMAVLMLEDKNIVSDPHLGY